MKKGGNPTRRFTPLQKTCIFCGRYCISYQSLEVHMTKHTGERPFQCDKCDANFKHYSALYVHNSVHLGIRHKCNICKKSFTALTNLSNHRKIHVKGGIVRRKVTNRVRKQVRVKGAFKEGNLGGSRKMASQSRGRKGAGSSESELPLVKLKRIVVTGGRGAGEGKNLDSSGVIKEEAPVPMKKRSSLFGSHQIANLVKGLERVTQLKKEGRSRSTSCSGSVEDDNLSEDLQRNEDVCRDAENNEQSSPDSGADSKCVPVEVGGMEEKSVVSGGADGESKDVSENHSKNGGGGETNSENVGHQRTKEPPEEVPKTEEEESSKCPHPSPKSSESQFPEMLYLPMDDPRTIQNSRYYPPPGSIPSGIYDLPPHPPNLFYKLGDQIMPVPSLHELRFFAPRPSPPPPPEPEDFLQEEEVETGPKLIEKKSSLKGKRKKTENVREAMKPPPPPSKKSPEGVLDVKDSTCPQCGKVFKYRSKMKAHMIVHLSKDQLPFPCKLCPKRFSRQTYLVNHLVSVHSTGGGGGGNSSKKKTGTGGNNRKQHQQKD